LDHISGDKAYLLLNQEKWMKHRRSVDFPPMPDSWSIFKLLTLTKYNRRSGQSRMATEIHFNFWCKPSQSKAGNREIFLIHILQETGFRQIHFKRNLLKESIWQIFDKGGG
jgi:hypothetical protein